MRSRRPTLEVLTEEPRLCRVGKLDLGGEALGELPGGRNRDSKAAAGFRDGLWGGSKSGFFGGTKRPTPLLTSLLLESASALGGGGANKALSSEGSLGDKDNLPSTAARHGFGVVGGVRRLPGAKLEEALSLFVLGGIKRLGGNLVFPDLENEASLTTCGSRDWFLGGENKPEIGLLLLLVAEFAGSVNLPGGGGAEKSPTNGLLENVGLDGMVETDELVLGGWNMPPRDEPALLESGRLGGMVETEELVLGGWDMTPREEPGPTEDATLLVECATEEASRVTNPESGWGAIF